MKFCATLCKNFDGNIFWNQKHFHNYFYLQNFYFHGDTSKNNPASIQSGTGLKKINDAESSPVPE
jgi:hypothetical protein